MLAIIDLPEADCFSFESQSSRRRVYFIRIPERGILIKITLLIKAMDIIARMAS